MRVLIPALALLALALPLPAAGATSTICTTPLIESVGVCVGQGCVTVYLGPSETPVCVTLADVHECTYDLVESVAACVDTATGCATLYLGPSEHPVCVGSILA